MLRRRLLLWSGLVIASFVVMHFANHALGLLSLQAMEAGRRAFAFIWRNPLGLTLFYGAVLVHFAVALWSLYRRSNLRLKGWEATQVVLGLLIPPLLLPHAIGTTGAYLLIDYNVTYLSVINALWFNDAQLLRQLALLLAVWLHLAVGLHFWLRLKHWYPRWLPVLYPVAVLLPVLALLGFVRAAWEVEALAAQPGWVEELLAPFDTADPERKALLDALLPVSLNIAGGALLAILGARLLRSLYRKRRGVFQLVFPSGKTVTAPVGATMLEAIRAAGIAHASACGGRGRCTTCRVRVNRQNSELKPPEAVERQALERIQAPPNVRLACQTRPRGKLAITPLLPSTAAVTEARRPGSVQGQERQAAFMFVDLRGSTALGERLLPYDVVFVLNQFFEEMVAALEATDGHYAQFNGDGLLAIYGLESTLATGCRQAVVGAVEMLVRLEALNQSLLPELGEPLRMGIGIHSGEAIIGSMGPPAAPIVSAIGDNVNIAARLETQSKILGCSLIVSEITAQNAHLDLSGFPHHEIAVRGRGQSVTVYAVNDPSAIPGMVQPQIVRASHPRTIGKRRAKA